MAKIIKKEIDLTEGIDKNTLLEDDKKAEQIEKQLTKTVSEKLARASHEDGEYIRYNKSHAKAFGKAFAINILPVEYKFQEGMKTFVLNEHVESILDTLEKRIRAEGEPIGNDPFYQEKNGQANLDNYKQA